MTGLSYLFLVAMQAMQLRIPTPSVTAAAADWQINNEPIIVQGLTYYPTRESRMFDPQSMMQVDVYKDVPIYADVSREPFTLVYVPVTPDRMRTYERPPDDNPTMISGRGRAEPRAVGTSGTLPPEPPPVAPAPTPLAGLESIPPPRRMEGIWVQFQGLKWYNDGTAVSYAPERFVRIGDYHGFAVYRERSGSPDRIWITTVRGGLLTTYKRR